MIIKQTHHRLSITKYEVYDYDGDLMDTFDYREHAELFVWNIIKQHAEVNRIEEAFECLMDEDIPFIMTHLTNKYRRLLP